VGDSDKVTTSTADITQPEPAQPKSETALTSKKGLTTSAVSTGGESSQPVGLQVSGETAVAIVEETSSSIADMIKELSKAGGSEVPMIEAGGVSTSVEYMAEWPFQPKDSQKSLISLSLTR